MLKRKFVTLPTIKSFDVLNYPMFKTDWTFKVQSGMNLMIGINAIGKTTTTNILTYGIVGNHQGVHEDLDPGYFMQRLEKPEESLKNKENPPQIFIDLQVGDHTVSFSRSLSEDKVLSLTVDKKTVSDNDGLTDKYTETIKSFTGLKDLSDLTFLISSLLIREEEGNYLLWDVGAQSRVLRLLFQHSDFSDEFKELENKLQEADSKYKREKDFMGRLEKRKRELEDDRKAQLSKNKDFTRKEDLISALEKAKDNRQEIVKQKDDLFLKSTQLRDKLTIAQNELNSLMSNYEENSDELKALESRFYKSSFADPTSEFIFSKISNRSICIVCNSHLTQKRVNEVVNRVENDHECPVCSSKLINTDGNSETLNARDTKRMETLEQIVKKSAPEIERLKRLCDELCAEVDTTNREIVSIDDQLTELNVQVALTTNKLDKLITKNGTPTTNFDFAIAELQNQIESYRQITEPLLRKYNMAKKQMEQKNENLNEAIENQNERLIKIFSNLAERYFGSSCSLVLNQRKPSGFEVPLSYFIPTLNGKDRFFQTRVSKSQAIFLEYLFRLSLLKLYLENTGTKPFLFLETSEGSFDVSNTTIMAETLTKIGKMGFPFVIITNLSKVDFILNLIPDDVERKKRTFNLLEVAHDSIFQGRSKASLTKILKQLNLN